MQKVFGLLLLLLIAPLGQADVGAGAKYEVIASPQPTDNEETIEMRGMNNAKTT